MQLQNPLRAICPTLEADVLAALAGGGHHTPGMLVRESGVRASVSGVRRCLERLRDTGIVEACGVGNRMEFALNTEHMMAPLVMEATRGTSRFVRKLGEQISRWDQQPLQVTLFGSAARGEMRTESDIDLLFIVPDGANDRLYLAIDELATYAYRLTGNDVRPLVYEVSEMRDAPIFESVLREGVHISGDSQWLVAHLHARMVA